MHNVKFILEVPITTKIGLKRKSSDKGNTVTFCVKITNEMIIFCKFTEFYLSWQTHLPPKSEPMCQISEVVVKMTYSVFSVGVLFKELIIFQRTLDILFHFSNCIHKIIYLHKSLSIFYNLLSKFFTIKLLNSF